MIVGKNLITIPNIVVFIRGCPRLSAFAVRRGDVFHHQTATEISRRARLFVAGTGRRNIVKHRRILRKLVDGKERREKIVLKTAVRATKIPAGARAAKRWIVQTRRRVV